MEVVVVHDIILTPLPSRFLHEWRCDSFVPQAVEGEVCMYVCTCICMLISCLSLVWSAQGTCMSSSYFNYLPCACMVLYCVCVCMQHAQESVLEFVSLLDRQLNNCPFQLSLPVVREIDLSLLWLAQHMHSSRNICMCICAYVYTQQ